MKFVIENSNTACSLWVFGEQLLRVLLKDRRNNVSTLMMLDERSSEAQVAFAD